MMRRAHVNTNYANLVTTRHILVARCYVNLFIVAMKFPGSFFLFYISFLVLSFVSGAAFFYFNDGFKRFVREAVQGGEAWYELYIAEEEDPQPVIKEAKRPQVLWNKSKALNGYTLITNHRNHLIKLIDMKGQTIHSWKASFYDIWDKPPHIKPSKRYHVGAPRAELLGSGDILVSFNARLDTPYGYGLAKLDRNSKPVWTYDQNVHHTLYIDQEDGDIYALIHSFIMETPKGFEDLPFPMLNDYVVRLDAEGNELERVSILHAFKNSEYYDLLKTEPFRKKWDHLHTNSVMKLEPDIADKFPMFKAGQVIISVRNPGVIAVLDMKTERIVWATAGEWKMQHDARFMPDGTISIFDNRGLNNKNHRRSQVMRINPETKETVWRHNGDNNEAFYTHYYGTAQPLRNGNTLISVSEQHKILEVTEKGELVWKYEYPRKHVGPLTNAIRYTGEELPFLFEESFSPTSGKP